MLPIAPDERQSPVPYTETVEVTLTDESDPKNFCRMTFGPYPDGTAPGKVEWMREDLAKADLPPWVTCRVWMRPIWEPEGFERIIASAVESLEASRV